MFDLPGSLHSGSAVAGTALWRMRLAGILVASCAVSSQAVAVQFGVNIAADRTTPALNARRAEIMKYRNITAARIGIVDAWGDTALRRDQAARIVANGGQVQASIFPSFANDHSCSADLAAIERRAYGETTKSVNKVKDVIHDFELMNETQLRPETAAEVANNSAGASTDPYEGKPCHASLAAALRGMAHAIHDVGASSGLPLRVILGEVGRDWGFLHFMRNQGVDFDVIGWHVYQTLGNESLLTDAWWGPQGPYAQLAKFGKPVHVNEFNCGEIYSSNYANEAGDPTTEKCLKALKKHLADLTAQKILNVEFVHIYELVDDPSKPAPENRFGLMYDLSKSKPHMFLYAAFTGGALTPAERREVTGRKLMTDAEIDARKARATVPAPRTGDRAQLDLEGIGAPAHGLRQPRSR